MPCAPARPCSQAVRRHTDCQWVLLYLQRWLEAPVSMPDGTLVERTRGTPQGAVVSPALANLFLHYVFDLDRKSTRLNSSHSQISYAVFCLKKKKKKNK